MLQQEKPEDFVIATGKQYSVRDFINEAAKNLDMKIEWRGRWLEEVGSLMAKIVINVDKDILDQLKLKLYWEMQVKLKKN